MNQKGFREMKNDYLHDIFEFVQAKKDKGEDILQLNVGEPEIDPPKKSIKELNNPLNKRKFKYGSAAGSEVLRVALAKENKVQKENVIIGPGSKFLIYAYLKSILTSSSDEVIIPTPYWSTFTYIIKDLGVNKIQYLDTSPENGWQFSKDRFNKLINKNTKCVILTNPNNPTSTLLKDDLVSWVLNQSREKGFNVLIDCAYTDLVYEEMDFIKQDTTNLDHVAFAFTFSKRFSMTGFRLGYLVSNEQTIEEIKEFNQITITNVPLFVQGAGLGALEENDTFTNKMRLIYKKRSELVSNMLDEKGVQFVKPKAGFYIFPNIGIDGLNYSNKILDKGVAVVPGSAFGPYKNYIRISLTETDERLTSGINTILQNI